MLLHTPLKSPTSCALECTATDHLCALKCTVTDHLCTQVHSYQPSDLCTRVHACLALPWIGILLKATHDQAPCITVMVLW